MSVTAISSVGAPRPGLKPSMRRLWVVAFVSALAASACSGSSGSTGPLASSGCSIGGQQQCALPTDPAASTATGGTPQLLALGSAADGEVGLWKLGASRAWQKVEAIPDARAIARNGAFVSIAHPTSLETRPIGALDKTGAGVALTWTVTTPSAPIVAIDRSIMGSTAIAASDEGGLTYGIASPDGAVIQLQGAPADSFTPLVAWLDQDQILVLSTGKDQASRLVAVNVSKRTSVTVQRLTGVRWFALSWDYKTVAAATGSGVYLGGASTWLGGGSPTQIIALGESQIVWQLALNQHGTQLAMLSGTLAVDGTVTGIRELGYTKTGASWSKTYDQPVPFTTCLGQVWID